MSSRLICVLLLISSVMLVESSMSKLVRAKRSEEKVEGVYFVEMESSVTISRIHDYVTELVALQKNKSIPGFKIELHGIVQETAHGFSAKLSEQALKEVLLVLYACGYVFELVCRIFYIYQSK
jgi:hypothetical protein